MTKESPRWNDAPRDSVRISFPEIPGFGDDAEEAAWQKEYDRKMEAWRAQHGQG